MKILRALGVIDSKIRAFEYFGNVFDSRFLFDQFELHRLLVRLSVFIEVNLNRVLDTYLVVSSIGRSSC